MSGFYVPIVDGQFRDKPLETGGKTRRRPLRPKPRRLTTANRTRVARMLAKGISASAIAAHFGVSTKVIEGLATDHPNRYTCSWLDEED